MNVLDRVARARAAEEAEWKAPSHWFRRFPAWAVALALHLLVAVALMNIVRYTTTRRGDRYFRVGIQRAVPPEENKVAAVEKPSARASGGDASGDQDNGTGGVHSEDSAPAGEPEENVVETPGSAGEERAMAARVPFSGRLGVAAPAKGTGGSGRNGTGGLYDGRGGAGRGTALKKNGGDGQTEEAVKLGLEWLARHQSDNGSWSPLNYRKECVKGQRCLGGESDPKLTAASTGLALLAFLGAGHSHNDGGPFASNVKKGLDWLLSQQSRHGCFDPTGQANFYTHGICTLAVTEAFALTQEPRFRAPAQKAIRFTCDNTTSTGGWDYSPWGTDRSDMSITSWQVMSLRSARAAGLSVPKSVWDGVITCMKRAVRDDGIAYSVYGWQGGCQTAGCNTMTAAGLATRQYLGMTDEPVLHDRFARMLLACPPRWDGVEGLCGKQSRGTANGQSHSSLYYTYNATLALFHMGGEAWETWNTQMRAVTLGGQKTKGCARGSWEPLPWDAKKAGRIYATAMNVMNLEVYYRYLPCYQSDSKQGYAALLDDAAWKEAAAGMKPMREVSKPPSEKPEEKPLDPATVKECIAQLKSEDMMKRRAAAQALTWTHPPEALVPMIAACRAERTSLKSILIECLAAWSLNRDLADYLVEELEHEAVEVRNAAKQALRSLTGLSHDTKEEWKRWRAALNKK